MDILLIRQHAADQPMNKTTPNTTKTMLFASLTTTIILPFNATIFAYADHDDNISTWQTDMTFDIKSSLNNISHASFTPATDFEDAADVWNNISSSWWDFTRDDADGDINIGAHPFGWILSDLAETSWVANGGTMAFAAVEFNTDKDFRDVNVSQSWWSYDYETVAIHEIGHVAGIHDHTETAGSPMRGHIPVNTVDRTLNSHDIATIGEMYQNE